MNLKPRRREEPEINLISLIDVVLMLVVFFMLSSTFLEEGRLAIKLPQADDVPIMRTPRDPLVIAVTSRGGYLVNGRELINTSPDTLRLALLKIAGEDRKQSVTVRADANATHQAVIPVMDVLGRLGFAEVSVATIKDEAAQP